MLHRLIAWLKGSPPPAPEMAASSSRPGAEREAREPAASLAPPHAPAARPAPRDEPARPSKAERKAERKAADRDAKRIRELEQRVAKAEERARRSDTSRSDRDDELKRALERAEQATERAKRAEQALKREEEAKARDSKQRRAKQPDAAAGKLKAAEDQRRAAEKRASDAELTASERAAQLSALERRCAELAEERDEQRRRAEKADARATAMEREVLTKDVESPHGRARPRTTLDVYFSPGDECLLAIRRALDSAERSIDACVFTITDDRIAHGLLEAHRRGVTVRIITDNDKSHDEGSDVRRLERGGIPVREDRSEFHMHHKFAVIDGKVALTGSYNWTRGAAHKNEENLVVSNDPRLVGPFEREFRELWKRLEAGD